MTNEIMTNGTTVEQIVPRTRVLRRPIGSLHLFISSLLLPTAPRTSHLIGHYFIGHWVIPQNAVWPKATSHQSVA